MVSHRKIRDSKLLNLRRWVTVEHAARLLSDSFREEVSEADLLMSALEGELKLSIYIPDSTPARLCLGGIADVGEPPEIKGFQDLYWLGRMLKAEGGICHLNEHLYDLPMIGAERSIVYHYWQQLRGATRQEYIYGLETVVQGQDVRLYLLQKFYFNDEFTVDFVNGELSVKPHSGTGDYGPSNGFPIGSELVVRMSALLQLEGPFGGEEAEKKAIANAEQPIEVKIEKDTAKNKNPNSAKQPINNKKESNLNNIDGHVVQLQPGVYVEELPSKKQAAPETGYLRLEQIIGNPEKGIRPIIPVSKSTWWAGVKSGRFPKAYKLTERTTGWKTSDVMALLEAMERGEG